MGGMLEIANSRNIYEGIIGKDGICMPRVRYLLLIIACLGLFAAGANASIIDGGTSIYGTTPPPAQIFYNVFDSLDAIANIQCNVYTYDSGLYEGKYAYTYQIHNTSDVDLSFVSMQIFNDVEIEDYGHDADSGINPNSWSPVPVNSSTPHSFDGHFNDTILRDEQSALLWFVSNYAPGIETGKGTLYGTYRGLDGDPWVGVYAKGELITPASIPEPATFLLLSMGTFAIIGRRRGSQEAV